MSNKIPQFEEGMAKRRRYLCAKAQQESPRDRIERFRALQQSSFALLRSSQHGYQHFLRRNYYLRRSEVVDGRWQPISIDRRP